MSAICSTRVPVYATLYVCSEDQSQITDHRSVGERRFSCYSDRQDDTLIAASVCLLISLHTSKLLSVPRC